MSENTGERFIPTQSTDVEVLSNLDRYRFAMEYCTDKKVLELGCGAGLGTYLYSLVAKEVFAVDYNQEALDMIGGYPLKDHPTIDSALNVSTAQMDLEKESPSGEYDVTVAMEILEHLANPDKVLREINTKYLVFSLPMYSMDISKWHKYPIRGGKEGVRDVEDLMKKGNFRIEKFEIQDRIGARYFKDAKWILGYAKRRKSWL